MEKTVEIMLKERIIDREALLQARHNLIGITKEQTLFILNVMAIIKNEGNKLTIGKISNSYNWDRKDAERIIGELFEHKVVKVTYREGKIIFNFDKLWERLTKTYLTPAPDAEVEIIVSWTARMLEVPESPAFKKQIEEWVKESGAKRIISIVEMIFKLNKESKVDLNTLRELYNAEQSDKKATEDKLKNIAKFDWLG